MFILICLLFTFDATARETKKSNDQQQVELTYSYLSFHTQNNPTVSHRFSNKLGNGQAITNTLIGVRQTTVYKDSYSADSVFTGQNSVGSDMTGYVHSFGLEDLGCYGGLVLGGYLQSTSGFRRKGLESDAYKIEGDQEFQPVVGVELGYKHDLTKQTFIRFNNVITPFVTNHSIAIGVSF